MGIFSHFKSIVEGLRSVEHQSKSTSQEKCLFEDAFRKNYFTTNKFYFESLLGNRISGREKLVESDIPILKEAYDKAHLKTQFEIDLHWRRTTHIWTLILALLVATGAILSQYFSAKEESRDFWAMAILIFSIVCIVVTQTSVSMLKVSHMWCRNWELHVVMLEPLFSGNLYQTHLGVGKTRFSISKLNNVFIWIALTCWIIIYELSIFTLSSSIINFILTTIVIFSLINITGLLIGRAIQSPDIPQMPYELSQYGVTPIPLKTSLQKNKEKLKIIGLHWLYGIIVFLLIITSSYVVIHFIEKIPLNMNMLESFLKADLRSIFSFPVTGKQE